MFYKSLIIIVMISLSFSFSLFPQSDHSDRPLSVAAAQDEEEIENESEGLFSSKYILLYQGGGILLLFALIRRLMGHGKKPDIQDKEI